MRRTPDPAPGQVLVENRAIGLNPVDWKVIASGLETWHPGHVPGVDGAGIVVGLGPGVHLAIGTRVAYHQALSRDGSFADFTCVAADSILLVPDALDDASASALPCPGLTAWQAADKISGGSGRDVLVTGAGGAVGLLLAQRCVEKGFRVWATAAPRHHHLLKGLGIVEAFDYRDNAWPSRLQAALGPRRLHAIVDTVGSQDAHALAPMIGYNGHLVYVMYREEAWPTPVFTSAVSMHEVALNSIHEFGTSADWKDWREMGAALFARAAVGQVRLPSITTCDFTGLTAALTTLKNGANDGKLVVMVNADA